MSLEQIEGYFRNYDKKSYEVFSQQGVEPSMADVEDFEKRIGFPFPDEFREFAVHPLGGLYMAVKEELWPRFRAYDVGPFWSFLYGFMVYGFSTQAPDWLQMSNARLEWPPSRMVNWARTIGPHTAELFERILSQKPILG